MFTQIERAIIDWMKAASAEGAGILPYQYKTAEAYPLDWEERLVSMPIQCPALFATFAGFRTVEQTSSGAQIEATYGIVVVAMNKRLGDAARAGGPIAGEIGAGQLAQDAVGLLQGQDFGLDISGLELIQGSFAEVTDAVVKKGLAVFGMQFQTRFTMEKGYFSPEAEFLGFFATLQSDIGQGDAPDADPLTTTQTLPQET